MDTYYKATQLNGTDFYSGTVDYAGALATGEPVRVKAPAAELHQLVRKVCSPTVLHASTEPAETLIGGSWPCRLFAVEGRPVATAGYKRGFVSLRVVEELPAWQALGSNGQQVVSVIDRASVLTADEALRLGAAWDAARSAAWDAAWSAAWDAAWSAAGDAVWDALRRAALGAAGDAAWDAALAYVARDLITDEQFRIIAGPWLDVIGDVSA